MTTLNEAAVRAAAIQIYKAHANQPGDNNSIANAVVDSIAAIISCALSASVPEPSLPSYTVNCHSCGARVELFPRAPTQSPLVCPSCNKNLWLNSEGKCNHCGTQCLQSPRSCVKCGRTVFDFHPDFCKCEFPASVADGGVEAMQRHFAEHPHVSLVDGIFGGVTPVVSKIRISVHDILTYLHNGDSIPKIRETYTLSEEAIKDAIVFAQDVYDEAVGCLRTESLTTVTGEEK